MQSDTAVVSIAAVFFNSCNYYNSNIYGQKTLHWKLRTVILSGMYNCNSEAINYVLKGEWEN